MHIAMQGHALPFFSPILAASRLPAMASSLVGNPPGWLYAARDPSRPGYLKLGQTTKPPFVRISEHAGYAQAEFEPVFWLETPDSIQSEDIWFVLLENLKHPDYRELFCVEDEVALEACRKAIAATRVLALPSKKASEVPEVTAQLEAASYLLRCPMQFRGKQVRLAEVVGLAQKDAQALRTLRKLGLESKGWDKTVAEYGFDFHAGGPLLKWLLGSPYALEDLGDFIKGELRVVFNIHPDLKKV